MTGRNSGEVSESARDTAVNKSGAVKSATAYQRAPTPPPRHSSKEVAKARPSIEETGQQDACYAGASEHRQAHERE
jgi:hypothetical protein